MSYVRVDNYNKQCQIATQIYKKYSKNPYHFWAVMSKVLEALNPPPELTEGRIQLLFNLAEKMVLKVHDKIEQEQEVQLYLMTLQFQVGSL